MIYYKIDVLKELKARGYSPIIIRKKGLLSEATLQGLRHGAPVNFKTLDILCDLLAMQPAQIIGHKNDGDGAPQE